MHPISSSGAFGPMMLDMTPLERQNSQKLQKAWSTGIPPAIMSAIWRYATVHSCERPSGTSNPVNPRTPRMYCDTADGVTP